MTASEGTRIEHGVRARVEEAPNALAVVEPGGRTLRYGELWSTTGRVCAELVRRGVGPGAVVAIAVDRSVDMVVSMLAVLRAGGAYLLLDPESPPGRNAGLAGDGGAEAVLVAGGRPSWWDSGDLPVWETADLADADPGTGADAEIDPETDAGTDAGTEATAYVAHTSGSTGRPKAIVVPHRAVLAFCADRRLCALGPDDRVASVTSPASDATTFEVWKPLLSGAAVVVLPHPLAVAPDEWPELLARTGVTTMFVMANLLDGVARVAPAAFAPLETLVFGGAAADPAAVRAVLDAGPPRRLVLGYGPTEATVFATAYECRLEDLVGRDRIPLGDPLDGYRVAVVEPDGPGDGTGAGELWIGGPGVAHGYRGAPEAHARAFVRGADGEPWYRSGDLVRRGEDGRIEFVGRVDRQLKIRGHRVEPEEVEAALVATGLVDAALVVGEDEPVPHLQCYFQPRGGPGDPAPSALAVELARRLGDRLPGAMIPAAWSAVTTMPVTSIGKIDRHRVRATAATGRDAGPPVE